MIGTRAYKSDTKSKQTADKLAARRDIFNALSDGCAWARFGIDVHAPASMAEDPTGDSLDTLLCAIQAAWAWTRRDEGFGMPDDTDRLEGWIADPLD